MQWSDTLHINNGLFSEEVTRYSYSVESKDLGPRSDFL